MTRILIVDDERSILQSTELLLTDMGYDVLTTGDHTKVLDLVRAKRPDIVLQDVRMPGLDLERLLETIRADPEVGKTPVLLFSASIDLPEISARVKANGLLEKPFTPEDVRKTIAPLGAPAPGKGMP